MGSRQGLDLTSLCPLRSVLNQGVSREVLRHLDTLGSSVWTGPLWPELHLTVLTPLLASDPLCVPLSMPADCPLKGHLLHDERKNSSPHSQCHPSLHRFRKGKRSLILDLAPPPLNPGPPTCSFCPDLAYINGAGRHQTRVRDGISFHLVCVAAQT